MTVEFIDPRGEPAIAPVPYELAAALEPGTTVGLLANGFQDSVVFLDAVADAMATLRPELDFARFDKGDASSVAGSTMLADIGDRCDVVVAAYGH